MAEKLKSSTWTDLVEKKLKIDGKLDGKDKALVKALQACEKADETKPEAFAKLLDELADQGNKLVVALARIKKDVGDKPFVEAKDKLHALIEEAETQAKAARSKALDEQVRAEKEAKAGKAPKGGEGDEDEADTPELLTKKLLPLIREIKKGEVRMPALVCTAGKNTAVLIMRRPIAASRRKVLMEAVDAKGGAKFLPGEVVFEKGALTFVMQAPAGGLAKRIRAALLNQTDLRLKVRVRGTDGDEEDGEDEGEPGAAPGTQAAQPTQGNRTAPPGGPASAEQLSYVQRLRKVRDRYDEALRNQHPEATKLRALMGFASEKADGDKEDYPAASQALDMLDKLLGAGGGASGTAAAEGANAERARAPSGEADAVRARMLTFVSGLKDAVAAGHPKAKDARLKFSEAGAFATKKDFARAGALLDEVDALLEAETLLDEAEEAKRESGATLPVDAWSAERDNVVSMLRDEIKAVVATGHPLAGKVELELRAVLGQLSGQLKTRQQAIEMELYLTDDDVVADVSELAFDLKSPLLRVLQQVKPTLHA